MYTMAIESRIRFITALFLFYKESQNFRLLFSYQKNNEDFIYFSLNRIGVESLQKSYQ